MSLARVGLRQLPGRGHCLALSHARLLLQRPARSRIAPFSTLPPLRDVRTTTSPPDPSTKPAPSSAGSPSSSRPGPGQAATVGRDGARESSLNDPVTSVYAGSGSPSGTQQAVDATVAASDGVTIGGGSSSKADVSGIPPAPAAPAATASNATGGSSGGKRKDSWSRKWVKRFARTILFVVVTTSGYIVYSAYVESHPPDQAPHDPSKKNLVILGNGWAATSLLKNLDNEGYNVTVISPRNYFCFTPLLPSVTVGTLESRSIMEPTRFITRHKARHVECYEGEAQEVDPVNKTVTFTDTSEIKGATSETTLPYDYLVYAVGAENNTFGIPGVKEHACFLKEIWDAEKVRKTVMDCVETATFKGQSNEEIDRLLHMVVVGGGPTGVELAGELHDFLAEDLANWYPEIAGRVRITLVEALPNVLPMFSKQLIEYTTSTFKENKIDVLTRTMVKEVQDKVIVAQGEDKKLHEIPYGMLVWATGNTSRPVTRKLMASIGEAQANKRGLQVNDRLELAGAKDIWALGDATATAYAPTAQAASQQGQYLARCFSQMYKKEKLEAALDSARAHKDQDTEGIMKQLRRVTNVKSFSYSHQGSLAYIGSDKAIADLPFLNGNVATGGVATMLFWRSAYVSTLFSLRNRALVVLDWAKVKIFRRDISRKLSLSFPRRMFGLAEAASVYRLSRQGTRLGKQVSEALRILTEALDTYGDDQISLSFNGGKDCTVILHLLAAAVCMRATGVRDHKSFKESDRLNGAHAAARPTSIQCMYVRCDSPFDEVESFVETCRARYQLKIDKVAASMKSALAQYQSSHPAVKAIIVGTRRGDPHGASLDSFQSTDPDWPQYMRVHPILDWSYADVWACLRSTELGPSGIGWCSLYDQGYTSLGSTHNTFPNPCLKAGEGYRPAWELQDESQERAGRGDPSPRAS
ncbi:uncharacterized protein L969DRAFT_91987 [Mixia osmundae IAM 14324]|uniref:NADH:ubiquinone reductase (non-electrogenic) n=1 Tax=Mixia osmundae (strain CBS 9802 / IAM 14324 / JCM 22182 / KY 12970) TaxID=764103 RepID=G7E2Y3_MIXOS|nr:uncharacterized protein L969DRAFT_91987 [Mixia osmundae IAM 14324]KEI42548.1 hypothetical protein L969DRAFT_91987 [Mixia osmundae IAM 14324]GAA97164.1 hypothetical protein E5Q_03840 [Mixia osmundae IAM 14324]